MHLIDDLRFQLASAEHMIKGQAVSIELMEEKLRRAFSKQDPKTQELATELALLQKRLSSLESFQQKAMQDIQRLATHSNQTADKISGQQLQLARMEDLIVQHSKRLEDIQQLKVTLKSISQAIAKPQHAYTVKPGDTLDKIAKEHSTTVDALKKSNRIEGDRIRVGEQLQLP